MEVRQIIKTVHDGGGFKIMAEYGDWKVGMLRYNERFSHFKELERHMLTDEVFALISGQATLYTENESCKMNIGEVYTIPAKVWHHIVVSEDASVLVVENGNTSATNTEKRYFNKGEI